MEIAIVLLIVLAAGWYVLRYLRKRMRGEIRSCTGCPSSGVQCQTCPLSKNQKKISDQKDAPSADNP